MQVHVLTLGECRCDTCRDSFGRLITTHAFHSVVSRMADRITRSGSLNAEESQAFNAAYNYRLDGARANFARK